MRRVARILLIVLASVGAVLWVGFYIYISALACAFGSVNSQNCRAKWPWELGGDDLIGMVVFPGGVFALMILGIWLLRPKPGAP